MWRLFPRSWFSPKHPNARAQAQVADALHTYWHDRLRRALSRVLRQPVAVTETTSTLRRIDVRFFIGLDQALRYGTWDVDLGRPEKGIVHLRPVDASEADSDAFLFTAACDANGFIREQALVAFEHCPGRLATAVALIRADDWVPQVREAGKRLLAQSIRAATGAELFEHLGLVISLQGRKRFKQEIWPQLIEPALLAPENADNRWEATRHGPASLRLFAYSLVAQADPERLGDACREAVVETDPSLAGWALTTARQSLPTDQQSDLARSGLRHPHGSVRAVALRLLGSADPHGSKDAVERSLFDRSRSTRNAAAYLMRGQFKAEPAVRWRQALAGEDIHRSCIAVEALADFAQPQDADLLLPWMSYRKGKICAAALRGLSRAKHPRLIGLATAALADSTTTVAREAIAILSDESGVFNTGLLLKARSKASNERVELLLIRSAHLLNKWDVLEAYLTWYLEFDPSRYHVLGVEMQRWRRSMSRRFTPLSQASKARIKEQLATLRAMRSSKLWDDLVHAVDHA